MERAAESAIRKAAFRLIPFLCASYAVNFLDRVNVGFAALAMNDDLGFTPEIFGFGVGIFFVGYILFEVPSNFALQRFGARIWIARIMISWGILATAMAAVFDERSFYLLRFLLGIAEAGFFPGIVLYLTYWFPRRTRARIVSIFMAAIPIATIIGGPVSGALLTLDGLGGLTGWQWLFIIEGLPAILLGVLALRLLPDRPRDAAWLSESESGALEAQLAAEADQARTHGYQGLLQAVTSPSFALLASTYLGLVIGLYGIGYWMPQLLKGFGLSNLNVGLVAAIPYLVAAIGMVAVGWHSDKTGERVWHVAISLFVSGAAFLWSAQTEDLPLAVVSLSLAALGIYAAIGTFWSLPTALLTGSGAAGGFALINSIGNCGGFIGPVVIGWLMGRTGGFEAPLLFLAASLGLGGVFALAFGRLHAPALFRAEG